MLPAIRHMSGDCFVFQQDSAIAHRVCTRHDSAATQENARLRRTRTLASKFTRPESSRLQDMGLKQNRVYQTAIHDVDELKQRLIAVLADMKQSVINKAIDEWRSRLAACVRAKGHFEDVLC